jgi:hypothetical protein
MLSFFLASGICKHAVDYHSIFLQLQGSLVSTVVPVTLCVYMTSFNLRVENAGNARRDDDALDVLSMPLCRVELAESTFDGRFDDISYRVFSIEYYWGSNMRDSFVV